MKRQILTLLALALSLSVWGMEPFDDESLPKLDPALIRQFDLGETPKPISATPSKGRREAGPTLLRKTLPSKNEGGKLEHVTFTQAEGQEFLNVMIQLDSLASLERLAQFDLKVNTVSGSWITAMLPPESLSDLAAESSVLYIHAAGKVPRCMDDSVPATQADQLHSPSNVKGQGVLVGIIDSGIDWQHEDFKKPDGTSRILFLWDQSDATGPNPSGFNYGSEWTKAQIDGGGCRETDTDTHGTHVAGTVAGDGSSTGGGQPAFRFVGMAPEADILFVKYSDSENSIVDGANYLYQKAAALGKPVAINISLATQRGPHDGTYPQDAMLNALIGAGKPGRILCIAASNEGDSDYPIHAAATLQAPEPDQGNYPYTAHRPWPDEQFFIAEVWYPAGQSVKLRLWVPTGTDSHSQTDWVAPGENVTFDINTGPISGAKAQITQQSPWQGGNTNLNYAEVSVWNPGSSSLPIGSYAYWLDFDGAGVTVDVWQPIRNTGGYIAPAGGSDQWRIIGDNAKTIGSPGSTRNAITVASYVTKTSWIDVNGATQIQQGVTLNAISGFSSRGPLRNGFQKPEIAAPGEVIVSTLSAQGTGIPAEHVERDGVHQKMQGTSMASPHVTGGCALLLQANPNLNNLEMKDLIQRHAVDAGPAGWDATWGSGKLNVKAAYDEIAAQDTPTPTRTATAVSPTPTATQPSDTPTPTTPLGPSLTMDGNGDGIVDELDLLLLLGEWHGTPAQMDGDSDSRVNSRDLMMLSGQWHAQGPTATPTPTATSTPDASTRQISISDYAGDPGAGFDLYVDTSRLKDVAGAYIHLNFDASLLQAGSATTTGDTAGMRIASNPQAGCIRMAIAGSQGLACETSGRLLKIPMQVLAGAVPGQQSTLTLQSTIAYGETGSTLNVTTSNGMFTVSGTPPPSTPTATVTATPTNTHPATATHTPTATKAVTNTPTSTATPSPTASTGGVWVEYPVDPNEPIMPEQDISLVKARILSGEFQVQVNSYVNYPADLDELFIEIDIDVNNDFSADYIIVQGTYWSDTLWNWVTEHALYSYNLMSGATKIKDLPAAQRSSDTLVQTGASVSDMPGFASSINFVVLLETYDQYGMAYDDYAPDIPSVYVYP